MTPTSTNLPPGSYAPAGTFRHAGAQGRARGGLRLRPRVVAGANVQASAQ